MKGLFVILLYRTLFFTLNVRIKLVLMVKTALYLMVQSDFKYLSVFMVNIAIDRITQMFWGNFDHCTELINSFGVLLAIGSNYPIYWTIVTPRKKTLWGNVVHLFKYS